MSNYVDTIQLASGTDYPIKVPNGVTYRNPSGMTPSQNPLLRRNDLVQTLSNDEDNPPSSKAVKTVTDGLTSQLTYDRDVLVSISGRQIIAEKFGKEIHYYSSNYVSYSDISSFTFPDKYKPDYNVYGSIQYYKSGEGYLVRQGVITTAGALIVYDNAGNPTTSYDAIAFSFTYIKQ